MLTIEYPRDVRTNRLFRVYTRVRCEQNPRVRAAVVERCRHDLLFYVNVFLMTYDPRKKVKTIPFVTWPFQDRAFRVLSETITRTEEEDRSEDVVIEKSRDMGASWICLTMMEHAWHFTEGTSFLMISRKEQLVDTPGDPACLFWKIDFIHRHLPEWLRPEMDRRRLHFGNKGTGATIDGESTTAASGVGDRRTAIFIDEFSRIEEGGALLAGTADTTRCRIFNFTPYGTNDAAYQLAQRQDVRKLRLHWSEHPEKAAGLYRYDEVARRVEVIDKSYKYPADFNFILDGKLRSPTYDHEAARRGNDRQMAIMWDIDYQGSAFQFFDRSLIVSLQRDYASPALWDGDVICDLQTAKNPGLLAGADGPLKLWCPLTGDKPPPSAYTIGGDLSMGTGASNSCLSIVDLRTGEKVGELVSPFMRPELFAVKAVALCWIFRDEDGEPAKLIWELQGPGQTFSGKVLELGFRNIYFRTREDGTLKKITDKAGWVPMPDTKLTLLEEYRSALATRQFLNRSYAALEECLYFIYLPTGEVAHSSAAGIQRWNDPGGSNDPSGARQNHGDRVIADALAWKMVKEAGINARKVKKEDRVPVLSLAWRRQLAEKKEREEAPLGF